MLGCWVPFGLCLRAFFTSSSFLSTNDINDLMVVSLADRLTIWGSGYWTSTWLLYLLYWQNMRRKKITRARRHARPQMRKRPQKLDRLKEFEAAPLLSALHSVPLNHSSWILWRLPFSDSVRIAVDKSSARGESLGKAYNRRQYDQKIFWREIHVRVCMCFDYSKQIHLQIPIHFLWKPDQLSWIYSILTRRSQHMEAHR